MLLRLACIVSVVGLAALVAACTPTDDQPAPPSSASARASSTPSSTHSAGGNAARFRAPSSGHLAVSAPVVQQGRRPMAAKLADVMVTARFRPAQNGRPVTVQRRAGSGKWTSVTTVAERHGKVRYTGPAQDPHGRPYAYRAVANSGGGDRSLTTRAEGVGQWQLKFSDDFSGSGLDLGTWGYRQEGVYSPESDRACSASVPGAVAVARGRLSLAAAENKSRTAADPCDQDDGNTRPDHAWYDNGHISTQDFNFRYGFAAARVKFDNRQGAHGSFWMQSSVVPQAGAGPDVNGAEVDVVESFGDGFSKWHAPKSVYSFVYYRDSAGNQFKVPADDDRRQVVTRAEAGLAPGDSFSKSYHVFSMLWTPKQYQFFVDGVPTQTVKRGVSHVPEYLILSMLTSGWELGNFPAGAHLHTDVDWVRVWQRPGWSCTGSPAC